MVRPGFILCLVCFANLLSAQENPLRERLRDENGVRSDVWVYNDIAEATRIARDSGKPLFVTFRCVPCKECAAFDAEVANGSDEVAEFAKDKFVSVRQVEMKGVDLSLFQFDHDLNWAAMFLHPDGTIYARYGTQSAAGPDAYNSVEGLLATMRRVLDLHARHPQVKQSLAGKRGTRTIDSALALPGLPNPAKYKAETTRSNCIHCHNIHDAEHFDAQAKGTLTREMLWRYPLPDNVGLSIDPTSGVRIAQIAEKSPADVAGVEPGEDILTMNGQPICSIADMQWVLHHVPADGGTLSVETSRTGKHTLELRQGWKEYDISWRGSIFSLSPRLRVWPPILAYEKRKALGIDDAHTALEVRYIGQEYPGGKAAYEAGLRLNDVIVELAGKPLTLNSEQFHAQIKLNYKVGDSVPITVLRDGKRVPLKIPLVE